MSDTALTQAPILPALKAGITFVATHWRRALIVGAPFALVYPVCAFATARMANDPVGVLLWILSVLALLVAGAAANTALLRMRLRGETPGFHGLTFGEDESRYLGVTALMIGLFLIVGLILIVPLVAVIVGVGIAVQAREDLSGDAVASGDAQLTSFFGPVEWIVMGLIVFGAIAFILWLAARLSMAFPATIQEGRTRLLSAWPVSHGNGWRIAMAVFVAGLATAAIQWGLSALIGAATGVSPLAPAGHAGLAFLGAIPLGLVQAGLIMPFWTGMICTIYLAIRGNRPLADKLV